MKADITINDPETFSYTPYSIQDILFKPLSHRPESSTVILGHQEAELIDIKLNELRYLVSQLAVIIKEKKIEQGDTVLLGSFYSSNELGNALLFAAFACMGIRVFIPIYPEVDEFDHWRSLTQFKCVIMPYKEILQQKGHDREKEVIHSFETLCSQNQLPFLDAYEDFNLPVLLSQLKDNTWKSHPGFTFPDSIAADTEAVIFTTSGTTGKSKLVVYTQEAFSISCQSWDKAGLFDQDICGNPVFTPLFTHTIGIRSFINALWTGQPVCIVVVDWFLNKPEVARYLLLQMKPGHVIGGPALFNMLIDFFRQFPELKIAMRTHLKTLISIGAPYSPATARQLKSALGLELLNAFGTTETQMVLLNKPRNENGFDHESLGTPLPGVSIGLNATEEKGIYELSIHSAYQSSRVINETSNHSIFSTGDLVTYDEVDGRLRFASRKGSDFIKDEFGVKIPVKGLREYYPWLFQITTHIEWILLDNKPGLAALLFLSPFHLDHSAPSIKEWIMNRNEILQSTLEPFEFIHRHLERFSVVTTDPPLTRKGTVSRQKTLSQFEEIITNLKNPYKSETRIESVDTEEKNMLYKYSDPRLATLLEALKIDVHFERGEKDFLYYRKDGKMESVLDLVGGFGAGILGHSHGEVKKAIQDFLDSDQPAINSQGSLYHYPALLARELNKQFSENTGRYFKVQFGNTGTEAMEIALHHAYYEWWTGLEKRRDEQLQLYGSLAEIDVAEIWEQNMKIAAAAAAGIIVINNCFHGYSSGARSLLNNKKQRFYFSGLLRPNAFHVDDRAENWKEQIEMHVNDQVLLLKTIIKEAGGYVVKQEKVSNIIAAVFEPVRGEGGIYEIQNEVADFLAEATFPLIADEIQCGLGRTGSFPAYPNATYYLLGKSLGGGYEKISAVLIDDAHFKYTFPQYYASTFANGEMAACASMAALEVIIRENITQTCRQKGNEFIYKINTIAFQYPDIIESVRGKGLMIGVHFNKEVGKRNTLLRVLCENDLLGYLVAGWLFHNRKIRVLPSLSKSDSIRLEPSAYISTESMDQFCQALNDLCQYCRKGNMYELLKFLMNDDPYLDHSEKKFEGIFPVDLEQPAPGALKVGFIGNFTMPPKELVLIEPSLQMASDTGLRILFNKMQSLLDGKSLRLFSKNLMNGKIHFTFYLLPFDTAHLEVVHRWGKKRFYNARIQETINQLSQDGVSHISLGAHTSIISGNGLYLAETHKVKILTGNTMTVASCLYHTEHYIKSNQRQLPKQLVIAITGANGNIGSGLAGCFTGESYRDTKIIMAGNNLKKLELLRKKIFNPHRVVECTTDLSDLQKADIIISCTNTNDPILFSNHIHPEKKVFIIDIAVPGSVAEEVKSLENVVFCKNASTVYLPDEPDFLISTHTPAGKVFCCAAEVMLAALYDVQLPLKGHLDSESVKAMMQLGIMEGFLNMKTYALSV